MHQIEFAGIRPKGASERKTGFPEPRGMDREVCDRNAATLHGHSQRHIQIVGTVEICRIDGDLVAATRHGAGHTHASFRRPPPRPRRKV